MGRTVRTRFTPNLPPVQKIELPSVTPKWRWALVILLLVLGVGALVYTFVTLFSAQSGWQEIEVNATDDLSCAGDFTLLYNLGASGIAAPAESRALTALYTQAATDAFKLFTGDIGYYDVHNVYYINRHPNEVIELDEALYLALEQIVASGDRSIYLGPVYDTYNGLFTCQDDLLTVDFDPYQNEALRESFAEFASFARDAQSVDLRLMEDNKVELFVSDDYLAYAEAEEVTDFIDFYWMKNAFIADYLADTLIAGGYTLGTLSSHDGFIRCLDGVSGTEYALNLYDRVDTTIYPAAVMRYSGARAICALRGYPLIDSDLSRFYVFEDGQVRTPYLDTRDGLCRNAIDDLVLTSQEMGCAQQLLRAIPSFIADAFDASAVDALASEGIASVYCRERTIVCSDPSLTIADVLVSEGVSYTVTYTGK